MFHLFRRFCKGDPHDRLIAHHGMFRSVVVYPEQRDLFPSPAVTDRADSLAELAVMESGLFLEFA